jgi:membrane protein implicated in regulation of membrane protease activity
MEWIYLASAIFGGSFLIPMVLGGLSSDMDVDFDTDVETDFELDADFDVDVDADVGELTADGPDAGSTSPISSGVDAGQAILSSILSFRSIVFFTAFFGVAGLVFGFLGYGTVVTAITAVALGVIAALANSMLWGLLKASETTSQVRERNLQGRPATVTVPVGGGRRGRIRMELSGQPIYMVAETFEGDEVIGPGRSVVVIQIERGVAVVAPLPELD